MAPAPLSVLIAGGGVAGLEALLGLHRLAGDRVRLTLVAPEPDFTFRPLAVAEPFALGRAQRVPLSALAEATGAELVLDALVGVDDAACTARLRDGGTRRFGALLVAPGARAVEGVPGATTWWPGGDAERYGGLLRDLEEGYSKRLAIVIPPGAVWPLPAYELALMTIGEARAMGQDDVEVAVVTPERTPLSLFGTEASDAVADELRQAGVQLHTGAVARVAPGGLVGRRARRLGGRGDGESAPLWWPAGKVAGEYLPQWLAGESAATPAAEEVPAPPGVEVRRPLSALHGGEARYLYDLSRQYRTDDRQIAALGRRIREVQGC